MASVSLVSPNGEREEQFLEKYFTCISHCEHDKAKELTVSKTTASHIRKFQYCLTIFLVNNDKVIGTYPNF